MISKKMIEEIKKRGLDPEDLIIEVLRKTIKLDPDIIIEARLELFKKYLIDGKSMLEKDSIQLSEKLYKAAEECLKALTIYFSLTDILLKVEERGGWTVADLEKAMLRISERIGEWFRHAWALHVWDSMKENLILRMLK